MKIVILTATGEWGGAEVQTMALATTLAGRGHKISIIELAHDIYSRAGFDFKNDGIEVVHKEFGKPIEKLSFWEAWSLSVVLKVTELFFKKESWKRPIGCSILRRDWPFQVT